MKSSLKKQAERFLREQKNYKRWLAVFLCLAVVVTIGTTAALKYKGIAVTTDNPDVEVHTEDEEIPEGMRRHVHTEACYEEQPVLICEAAKAEAGETAEAGVGETAEAGAADAGTSNAGAAEESKPADTAQGHTHSDSCYEVTGGTEKLTCTKEEHTHGDGCYETKVVTETVTKTVPETVNEEVTDEDGNVTTVSKTVDKTVEETVEKEEKVLTCAKEEHSHGASCYTVEGGERTLVCGKEEGEGAEAPAAEEAVPAVVNADAVAVPAAETAAPAAAEVPAESAPAAEAAAESTDTADAADKATESTAADNTETSTAEDAGAERTAAETTDTENTETAEEVTGEHVHDESCYELQMVLICGKEEGELEEIPEEFTDGVLSVKGNDYEVIISYTADAKIPENAELKVEELEKDSKAYREHYEQMVAALPEDQQEEEVAFARFFDITILSDGEEIEPEAEVTVQINYDNAVVNEEETGYAIHFPNEGGTEIIDAEVRDGKEFGYNQDSFSVGGTFALRKTAMVYRKVTINSLNDINESASYLIVYEKDGNGCIMGDSQYAYNSGLDDAYFKLNEEIQTKDITIPDIYEGIVEWKFTKSNNNYYIQSANDERYLNIGNGSLSTSGSSQAISISQTNGKIKLSKRIQSGWQNTTYYVSYVTGDYFRTTTNDNDKTALTLYEKVEKDLPDTYTVNYWKNENSVTSFQSNVTDKGTLVGKIVLTPEEVDGRFYITIPLTGSMSDNNGKSNEIGKLEDYVRREEGHTYKFYGWSQVSSANYKWGKSEEIYRGENITIDNIALPKNPADGEIRIDVTDQGDQNIDLYAIWAAPSRAEGENGVVYYGGGQTSPTGSQYGVYFFVSITGQIPNEPGSFGAGNYTDGIRAKDENGNEILNPLYYWMHIYGAGNEKAVSANLRYRPTEEDIWRAVRAKGTIAVNGNNVDFDKMSQTEFTSKYYVVWYVCKDQGNFWHIDGSLMEKGTKWNLAYDGNGADDANAVIQQKQYDYNNDAIVKNSLENGVQSDKVLIRKGYNFLGWETWTTGENGEKTAITDFTCNDLITVDSEGNVYKGPDKVEGLKADQDEGGVWTVTLHAKWEKITHDYKIVKAWEHKDSVINPLIESIKVEISRYAVDSNNKPLVTDEKGNAIKEIVYQEVELKSPSWSKTVTLDETDDSGNTYVYEMREVKIDDATGKEIIGATESYEMGYKRENRLYTLTNTFDPTKAASIIVKKTKEDGETPLLGAEFKLSRKNPDAAGDYTEIVDENKYISAGDEGIAIKGELIVGDYKLEEVKAPEGYQKNNESVMFQVRNTGTSENPKMIITSISDHSDEWAWDEETKTFTLKNKEMKMAVKVKKVPSDNTDGGVLGGAEFVVKNTEGKYLTSDGKWSDTLEGNCKFATAETGENEGIVELPELPAGEYTLEEVKAPDGYNLRGGSIPFVVQLNSDKTGLELTKKPGESTGDKYIGVVINKEEKTIKVSNSAGIILPETGGPGTIAYTFGGLAMIIAVSLMYGLSMRRKREKGGLN